MNAEFFINIMKQIVTAFELTTSQDSPMIRELMMWRTRFMESQAEEIKQKFIMVSCQIMMAQTPEELLAKVTQEAVLEQQAKTSCQSSDTVVTQDDLVVEGIIASS